MAWENHGSSALHSRTFDEGNEGKANQCVHSFGKPFRSDCKIAQFSKRLLGQTIVEDALLRLDLLTKEENLMAVARILEVANHVDEIINMAPKTTQPVHDTVNNLKAETRIANRAAQATSASVYRSLDLFINVLTDFLALCLIVDRIIRSSDPNPMSLIIDAET